MLIRQLTYLVALAKEQHFGRAAEACCVSQPALSGAIRSIEQELGLTIVQRGRRFEGFTPDGERVLAWARRALAECEGLRQEARTTIKDPEGTLRIGAIPTTLPVIPLLTDGCLQSFPQAPFSQPRNVFFGHVLTTSVGLVFLTAFGPGWLPMAAAAALAVALMILTKTVHPPAGSNPVIVFVGHSTWSFLLVPTALGAAMILTIAWVFWRLKSTGR